MKGTAVQRPFEGRIREHQEAKVLGGVGEENGRGGEEGVSGGEKLRKVSRQYPQKGNVWRQKAGCLGLEEGGDCGVMPRSMQFLYETMEMV